MTFQNDLLVKIWLSSISTPVDIWQSNIYIGLVKGLLYWPKAQPNSNRPCICVLGVDFVLYIVLMYFGTVSTVLYHLLYIYYHFKNYVQLIGCLQKMHPNYFIKKVLSSNDIATKLLTFMKQYVSYFLPMINGSNHSCMEYWINWLVQY